MYESKVQHEWNVCEKERKANTAKAENKYTPDKCVYKLILKSERGVEL